MISELQSLVKAWGDQEVVDSEGRPVDIEYNEDEVPCFVVE